MGFKFRVLVFAIDDAILSMYKRDQYLQLYVQLESIKLKNISMICKEKSRTTKQKAVLMVFAISGKKNFSTFIVILGVSLNPAF